MLPVGFKGLLTPRSSLPPITLVYPVEGCGLLVGFFTPPPEGVPLVAGAVWCRFCSAGRNGYPFVTDIHYWANTYC